MPTLTTSIQHSIGSPSHSNHTIKRNKICPNQKGKVKLLLYAYNMTYCIEHPEDSIKTIRLVNVGSMTQD